MNRLYRALMGVLITLYVATPLLLSLVTAEAPLFTLINYNYKSRAGEEEIYPGSRDIALTVNVRYIGDSPVYVSAGCIQLPAGFTPSRGYSACTPPQTPNGTTYDIIHTNDVVVFNYHLDVSTDVAPGSYVLSLIIYYRMQNASGSEVLNNIVIEVSSYPELSLTVANWYWSPAGYPGSDGVYLYVTLRNTGGSRILSARGEARLPEDAFSPSTISFQIANIGKDEYATIGLGPISIYPSANPNITYQVQLDLNATMSTNDGVQYHAQGSIVFNISLTPPPIIHLEVVDYGLETPRPVEGSRQARFYMVIVNKDFKTIRSVTAYYYIATPGAVFVNGSSSSVSILEATLGYGNAASIYSEPIVLGSVHQLVINVSLLIFGDDNGAEFWSTINYEFAVSIEEPLVDLEVVNVYWSSGGVYPGSENAVLNIVLLNNDIVDVRDAVVSITLPEGFYPRCLTVSNVLVQRGSMTTVSFTGISISNSTIPGEYPAILVVQGVAWDISTNTYYAFTANYTVAVNVSETPVFKILTVATSGWIGGRAYTTSVNAAFYAYLQVTAPGYTIRGLKVKVNLPDQLLFTNGEKYSTATLGNIYRYGDFIYVEFAGVDVVTDKSGPVPVVLEVEGLASSGGDYWFREYHTILLPILEPSLNLTLVDASWSVNPVSSEASELGVSITMQSTSIDTITSITARLTLTNAVYSSGREEAIVSVQRPVNYGEVFTLDFTGVNINATALNAVLEVYAVLSTGRSMYYRAVRVYNVSMNTLTELNAFRIIGVHTVIAGSYTPLLPSSRGVSIVIELANSKPYRVSWIQVNATGTSDVKINDITGTCVNGLAPAGTCTITLNVDVSPNATPGSRSIELLLKYAVATAQGVSLFSERHVVDFAIADAKYYEPELKLVSTYWGVQAPMRVLVGQRNVPLSIVIINTGYYSLDGVYVYVKPLNNTVLMVTDSSMCTPRLTTGASCSVTLYTDLSMVEKPGELFFEVSVNYLFTVFNTLMEGSKEFTAKLRVDEPASGSGLLLVDSSWANNWPVYPSTENATLQVILANKWPYRISGVQLELVLPKGFHSKTGNVAQAYIPGPINSLQELAAEFTINIEGVEPGIYTAKLSASYIVETGTPNTRVFEDYNVTLIVNNPYSSIQPIIVDWIGRAPEPPEYGALLMVALRNNLNPSMKGPVLELELPEGFLDAASNTSHMKVIASSTNILQQVQIQPLGLQTGGFNPQLIQELISRVQTGGASGFTYGDVLYFYLKLNIVTERRGVFVFSGNLSFIDHWNNKRVIPISFNVSLLGSSKIIEVYAPTSLRVVNGTSNLSIKVLNKGSGPLYNIYVYLIPYGGMLIPQDAVKYIDELPPGGIVLVNYTLIYNPFAVATGGVQAYLRYMTAPFNLAISYRDVYGYTGYYNTSIAVLVEPFIELVLSSTKATLSGGTLSISGVILNYGIATARSIVVKAVYMDKSTETLVGDLDPASQMAFRLEMSVGSGGGDKVLLIVSYRDEYGRVEELNYTLSINRVESIATTSPKQSEGLLPGYATVSISVVVFLAVIALLIYRYLKKHSLKTP
jgi:hypothetical protein